MKQLKKGPNEELDVNYSRYEKSPQDFFISYNNADRIWAEWIAWQLKEEGYATILPNFGLRSGYNFALEIDKIRKEARQIIVVLSPDYIRSLYAQLEWAFVLKQDTIGKHGLVLLVHVRECSQILKEVLGPIDYIDLVGQSKSIARATLLEKVDREHGKKRASDTSLSYPQTDETLRATLKKSVNILNAEEYTRPRIFNVPFSRNPFFTDREEVLKRLYATLRTGKITTITQPQAINGMGGIGKTQIAVEYAYRYGKDYNAILFARADSHEVITSEFVNMARLLDLAERGEQDQSRIIASVKRWLKDHTDWLLMLDNVEDLEMVDEFIPAGCSGHVLLTTRVQAFGTLAQGIEIDKLNPEDGALFLLRRVKIIDRDASLSQASNADCITAEEISRLMDGLPLALDQAGAYIDQTRYDLSSYMKLYQTHRFELLEQRGNYPSEHPQSVATTLSLAFRNVEEANPAAADLLRFCAFLAPEGIPEEIIVEGAPDLGPLLSTYIADQLKLDAAIEELRKYSLIRRNPYTKTLDIHRLIQVVLKDEMDTFTQELWAERAVRAVNRAFPDATMFVSWQRCERCYHHAQACADLIKRWNMMFPEAIRLLLQAGAYLWQRVYYTQAEPLFQHALYIQEKLLGPDHSDVAHTLTNLAKLYSAQGRYSLAEQFCQRALSIQENALDPEHLEIAESLNELGWLNRAQGKYKQAEPLFLRALSLREKTLGFDHSDVAQTLNDLAWLYYNLGKYAQAQLLHQRALTIRQQVLGLEHPLVASSLNNLAWLYHVQGKYAQAEPLYQQALALREQTLGMDHTDVAQTLDNLARLYVDQEKYAQAESLYKRALAIREQALGSRHPDVALSLHGLASLHFAQKKYIQSERFYQRTLKIRQKVLGSDHPRVAQTLNDLARLYYTQGNYIPAESLLIKALEIRQQALGLDHPDVATSFNDLAELYFMQGKYIQAELYYKRALIIRERVLDAGHPNIAVVLDGYSHLLRQTNRVSEAENLMKRAQAIRNQWARENSPSYELGSDVVGRVEKHV